MRETHAQCVRLESSVNRKFKEIKEAFNMIDQNRDGFIDKPSRNVLRKSEEKIVFRLSVIAEADRVNISGKQATRVAPIWVHSPSSTPERLSGMTRNL